MSFLEIEDARLTSERKRFDAIDEDIRLARKQNALDREKAEEPLKRQNEAKQHAAEELKNAIEGMQESELIDQIKIYQSGIPIFATSPDGLAEDQKPSFLKAVAALKINPAQVQEDVDAYKRHLWYADYLRDYEGQLAKKHEEVNATKTKFDAAKVEYDLRKTAFDAATLAHKDLWTTCTVGYRAHKGNNPRIFDNPSELAKRILGFELRTSKKIDAILAGNVNALPV